MMKVYIETQRLILREIRKTDIEDMFELDSDKEVHKYLGNKPVSTLQEVENIIAYITKQYDENGLGRLALIRKDTMEWIGWSGLKYETVVRPEQPYYDLGYRLKRKHWGQGFATESAIASLEYGFKDRKFKEIFAAAEIENFGSNHVLQKVGMQKLDNFFYEATECCWYRMSHTDWKNKTS